MFFTVWSLFAGMMSGLSMDFQNLVKAFSTAIFWLSGIVYDVDTMSSHILRTILKFNPVTVIAGGYRKAFIYKQWFWEDPSYLICYCVTFTVFLCLALWVFKKLRREIPDVM